MEMQQDTDSPALMQLQMWAAKSGKTSFICCVQQLNAAMCVCFVQEDTFHGNA